MIWANPWAWAGLTALAIPIAVHLLSRQPARRVRFPTLRFVPARIASAVERRRLTDLPLLAIRLLTILAAVGALAQPFVWTAARRRAAQSTGSRAVVVDTSASVDGAGAAAVPAADPSLRVSRTFESPDLTRAVAAASAWLSVQPPPRELVVVSDFQLGAIDRADLAALPGDQAIRLVPVATPARDAGDGTPVLAGDRVVTPRVAVSDAGTRVDWRTSRMVATPASVVRVDAAPAAPAAAILAAASAGSPVGRLAGDVMIVRADAPDYAHRLAAAEPLHAAWMLSAAAAIQHDATLAALAEEATRAIAPTDARTPASAAAAAAAVPGRAASVATIARDRDGRPMVGVAADAGTLVLVVDTTDDLVTAAVAAAAWRAVVVTTPASELEPARVPASEMATWQRPRPTADGPAAGDASDGRWLWIAALALLGLETWMRRGRAAVAPVEAARARVA